MRCLWRTSPPPEPQWPHDSQAYLVRIALDGLPGWTTSLEWRRVAGEGCRWGIGAENQHWVTHWLDGVSEPDEGNTDVTPTREPGEWRTIAHAEDYPDMRPQLLDVESRDYRGEAYYSSRWWRRSDDGAWGLAPDSRAGVAIRWRPIE